ncbi:hypothetical protein L6R49_30140, partial [Myxococcota bacterium]|nr:hypothetical protein [Myxococcota bacterium]
MVTFARLLILLFVVLLNPGLALAQSLTELILVIGVDDSLDEPSLRLALQLADARAEPLLTNAPADAPPTLLGAYVVTVPAHKATTLTELLSLDAENVARVEDNVRVFAPPNQGEGPCEGEGGLTSVNDPLAGAQ